MPSRGITCPLFGNSSSIHSFGRDAKKALLDSRKKIARLINANTDEIFFTSGGTESDNIAIKGIAYNALNHGKNHIITSQIEHNAILNSCRFLEKQGFDVTYLPVDECGLVDMGTLKGSITDKTCIISIMHANNEIGTIEPIKEIGKIARDNGVYFHTDAVQTVGKIPVDVGEFCIDLLSISGHKIYGPKGVGALYIRDTVRNSAETNIDPIIHGGGHEYGIRPGTENIPGIVGLAKAIELSMEQMNEESKRQILLRDRLIGEILKGVDDCRLNGHPRNRLPNNANFSFDGVYGKSLLLRLDVKGIATSTVSACSSGSSKPSHVLTAIGLKPEQAKGSLRITLGRSNTEADIMYLLKVLPDIVSDLRRPL